MTLQDVQIDRWSRQILVSDVGGRGQERLCAARVAVLGSGEAARTASALIARAGVTVEARGAALVVAVDAPAGDARRAVLGGTSASAIGVLSLVGRPCPACAQEPRPRPATGRSPAEAAILGALAASETLRVLLDDDPSSRLLTWDPTTGAGTTRTLPHAEACGRCTART